MPLLTCTDLVITYQNKIAVNRVSFEVEAGDYICIVGENGSGKSSLLKGILQLVPIQSGVITFHKDLKSTQIGYLPQQTFIQQNFPASAFEIVLSGCLNQRGWRPFFTKKEKVRALKNMELLEISHIKNMGFQTLSGGQQQRVLMARALCATEKLLILDEPVTGLDPLVMQTFYTLIQQLNKEKQMTILMISHDVNTAVQYANKILHLNHKCLFFGTTDDYIHSALGKQFLKGNLS